MVGHAEPLDRVHVGREPERVEVVVRVHQLHHLVELRVVTIGNVHGDPGGEALLDGATRRVALGHHLRVEPLLYDVFLLDHASSHAARSAPSTTTTVPAILSCMHCRFGSQSSWANPRNPVASPA